MVHDKIWTNWLSLKTLGNIFEPREYVGLAPEKPTTALGEILKSLVPPSESDIDKAFVDGTRAICNLLSEDKIDKEIAKEILTIFVCFYVESKVDLTISNYISKKGANNYLLKMLEAQAEGD